MLAYEKMAWLLIWFVDSAKFLVTVPSFKPSSKQLDVQFVNCDETGDKAGYDLGCGDVVMDSLLSWHQMDDGTVVLFMVYFTVCCSAVQGFYVISG